MSCFSDDDTLVLTKAHRSVRIIYSSARASVAPSDLTEMELRLRHGTEEMWIGSLHVAVPFRRMGLGRQLVEAAEEIARAAGVAVINVFPLYSSRSFWLKMGYRSHLATSGVLSKYVNSSQKPTATSLTRRNGVPR